MDNDNNRRKDTGKIGKRSRPRTPFMKQIIEDRENQL